MKLNLNFVLFFAFSISSSIAQEVICEFGNRFIDGVNVYSCGVIVNNPEGLELTSISGIHLEGFTDADVRGISRINGSFNAPFPSVFCQRFPNIQKISIYSAGVTALTDDSFGGCPSLDYLAILANQISSISANAFVNNEALGFIDLDGNQLTTLPEGVFSSLSSLTTLDIRNNPFENIPNGVFTGLTALQTLFMQNVRISTLNPAWFLGTPNLRSLYIGNNDIREVSADSLINLDNLINLSLYGNNIQNFQAESFTGLTNLQSLDIGSNQITEINENSFVGLENLLSLSLYGNSFSFIANGTFRVLTRLQTLSLSSAGIRELDVDAFEGLNELTSINLNFNNLEDLPAGIFAFSDRLIYVGLWSNRLKSFTRNLFASNISSINTIDLDNNNVNSIERSVLEDSTQLNTLFLSNNLCANGIFSGFIANRVDFMQRLERCFRNFELIVEATTDNNLDYLFFAGENPGIAFRVQAEDEIQIALTPFNFPWSPMLEVIIGAANNTRSIIRRNQNEEVAVVPSPGIIRTDQLNLFRIVWANNVILVFRENEQWPFLVHTMIDFFNVNFYGLRTPQSRATWSVQPVDF